MVGLVHHGSSSTSTYLKPYDHGIVVFVVYHLHRAQSQNGGGVVGCAVVVMMVLAGCTIIIIIVILDYDY